MLHTFNNPAIITNFQITHLTPTSLTTCHQLSHRWQPSNWITILVHFIFNCNGWLCCLSITLHAHASSALILKIMILLLMLLWCLVRLWIGFYPLGVGVYYLLIDWLSRRRLPDTLPKTTLILPRRSPTAPLPQP